MEVGAWGRAPDGGLGHLHGSRDGQDGPLVLGNGGDVPRFRNQCRGGFLHCRRVLRHAAQQLVRVAAHGRAHRAGHARYHSPGAGSRETGAIHAAGCAVPRERRDAGGVVPQGWVLVGSRVRHRSDGGAGRDGVTGWRGPSWHPPAGTPGGVNIVVIGAGFGGLATAIRLAARGHDVELIEKRAEAGGRAGVFRQDGFTFDAGPTILTAPQMIADLFRCSGRRMEDFVRLVAVNPFYRVRFHDGTSIEWTGDDRERCDAISRLSPGDVDGYVAFARESRAIFDEAFPLIDQPFESIGSMMRAVPGLAKARAWRSVATVVDSHVRDPRIRQLLGFHPLLIGGNPFDSPSIYALIHELERRWGVWYAMGGTGALVAALVRLLLESGGRFRPNAEVAA